MRLTNKRAMNRAMLESVSAADPSKYYWMRYASDRATNINTPKGKVRIEKGAIFGVRELRGKDVDEVVIAATGEAFKLAINASEKLMDKAKEFKGKTPQIAKPSAAKTAPPGKTSVKATAKEPQVKTIQGRAVVLAPSLTDPLAKDMRALIRKSGVPTDTSALVKSNIVTLLTKVTQLTDSATALRMKAWLLTQKLKPTVKDYVATYKIGGIQQPVKVQRAPKEKQPAVVVKPNKLKLSDVEMPEVDDFTDDSVPTEFQRFINDDSLSSQSNPSKLAKGK